MTLQYLSNSKVASACAAPICPSERQGSEDGVYVGRTKIYRMPFFINRNDLLNPHMAVVGTSGSGKTYFLKSFIARSRLSGECGVLVIDWSGEYEQVISFLGGRTVRPAVPFSFDPQLLDGTTSINLSGISNGLERAAVVREVMASVIEIMHGMQPSQTRQHIIVLDEAWKVVEKSGALGQLFREGRKYGIGIVVASQLAEDFNNEILANSACLVAFRVQNGTDYSILTASGAMEEYARERLWDFRTGECMIRMALKSEHGKARTAFIRKVDGVNMNVYDITSGSMQLKISSSRFLEAIKATVKSPEIAGKIVNFVESNGNVVDLVGIFGFMSRNGIERPDAVSCMRLLGLEDMVIVEAYEASGGGENEI